MNEVEDVDQDTAPRDISIRVKGRYPGSQDLTYRLPMNWRIHSGMVDMSTLAYRCGGSPGISPGSRLTRLNNLIQPGTSNVARILPESENPV